MIRNLRRCATVAVMAAKVAMSQDELIEVITTIVLLLSVVVEILQMWLDRRDKKRVSEVRQQ